MTIARFTLLFVVLLAACKDTSSGPPPPAPMGDVRGWQAIPDNARVVVGVEPVAFARSEFLVGLVGRGLGESEHARIADLLSRAKVAVPKDVRRVTLVLGDEVDEHLLVVEGNIDERQFADAVSTLVKKNGGRLRRTTWRGRPVYQVRAGAYGLSVSPAVAWFTFSASDTLLVSGGEGWLRHARDPDRDKFDKDAMPAKVDGQRAMWFASSGLGATGEALRDLAGGKMTQPVQALSGTLRLGDDAALVGTIVLQLGSAADAEAFAALLQQQLPELNSIAHELGVRAMLHKIDVAATGPLVRASLTLQREELAKLATSLFAPAERQENE